MAKKDILEKEFGEDHELEAVLKEISKQYGEGSVMLLGDSPTMDIDTISTGSLSLDVATGIGGYPLFHFIGIACCNADEPSLIVEQEAQQGG